MSASFERLETLLVEEALGRLADTDRAELDVLLAENPEIDRYAFERTAAAVFLAVVPVADTKLPSALYSQLQASGERLSGKS